MKYFKQNLNGFTLIELLVVMAIISILATLGTISFKGGIEKARSAKKQSDLRTIESALVIYFVKNGMYPTSGTNAINQDANNWSTFQESLGASSLVPHQAVSGVQYCYFVDNRLSPKRFAVIATDFENTIPINAVQEDIDDTMVLITTSNNSNQCNGRLKDGVFCAAPGTEGDFGKDYCLKSAPVIEFIFN